MWILPPNFNWTSGNIFVGIVIVAILCVFCGPAPVIAVLFDISDQQVFILTCGLVLLYWVSLSLLVGFFQWQDFKSIEETQTKPILSQIKKQIRWKIEVITAVFGLILFFVAKENFFYGRSFVGQNNGAIIDHLRQIDAAKNQFALEKKTSLDYIPTEADLTPYIRLQDGKLPHVGEERYVLNPIREAPYAIFDKNRRIRRHGFSEDYTITNGTTYRLQ